MSGGMGSGGGMDNFHPSNMFGQQDTRPNPGAMGIDLGAGINTSLTNKLNDNAQQQHDYDQQQQQKQASDQQAQQQQAANSAMQARQNADAQKQAAVGQGLQKENDFETSFLNAHRLKTGRQIFPSMFGGQ